MNQSSPEYEEDGKDNSDTLEETPVKEKKRVTFNLKGTHEDVKELTDEFVSLAGPSVEQLREQLGPAPAPEAFNAQAMYVAALLNPIVPINDDFLFIRPAVMTARSTANRLDYAERGLRDAIRRLQ